MAMGEVSLYDQKQICAKTRTNDSIEILNENVNDASNSIEMIMLHVFRVGDKNEMKQYEIWCRATYINFC